VTNLVKIWESILPESNSIQCRFKSAHPPSPAINLFFMNIYEDTN